MNILAVDTSSPSATVAVLNDKKLLAEYTVNNNKTHSQIIMSMICDALKFANISIEDIDVFATGIGPGSFTGLRIGIATIKAFVQALDKKIIGVSSLDMLSRNIYCDEKIICPICDARRGNVYNGLYLNRNCIEKDRIIHISELCDELLKMDKNIIFLGDALDLHRDFISQKLKERCEFAPQSLSFAKAGCVAQIAYERAMCDDFDDIYSLEPIYVRATQAERELQV